MSSRSTPRWCLAVLVLLAACEPSALPTSAAAPPTPIAGGSRLVALPSLGGAPLAVELLDPAGHGRPVRALFREAGVATLAFDLTWRREGGRWLPRARVARGRPSAAPAWATSLTADGDGGPCLDEASRLAHAFSTLASWCAISEFACAAGYDLVQIRLTDWQTCLFNAV